VFFAGTWSGTKAHHCIMSTMIPHWRFAATPCASTPCREDSILISCGVLESAFKPRLSIPATIGLQSQKRYIYITTKDAPKNRQISSRNATISLAWTVLKMHQNSGYFITKCNNLLHGLRSKCTIILEISSSNATISYMDCL
jgi:hypothetical protein